MSEHRKAFLKEIESRLILYHVRKISQACMIRSDEQSKEQSEQSDL